MGVFGWILTVLGSIGATLVGWFLLILLSLCPGLLCGDEGGSEMELLMMLSFATAGFALLFAALGKPAAVGAVGLIYGCAWAFTLSAWDVEQELFLLYTAPGLLLLTASVPGWLSGGWELDVPRPDAGDHATPPQ